jgi:predicted dehydrogenase
VTVCGEAANAKGLGIVSGTQRRHQASYIETMRRIHDGAIGELISAQCYWNQGGLWHHGRQPEWSDMEWQIRNWLYFTWLSGDHICEQHVHNIDVVNWAMRAHPAAGRSGPRRSGGISSTTLS